MKVLMTGNMGYVGPRLLEQLRQSVPGAVLVGVDTGFFAHCLTGVDIFPESRLDVQHYQNLYKLAEGCRLRRNIAKDQVITDADVELPAGRLCDQLRAEQNQCFAVPPCPGRRDHEVCREIL